MPRGQKDHDGAQERKGADQEAGRAEARDANAKAGNPEGVPEGVPEGDKGHDPAKGS